MNQLVKHSGKGEYRILTTYGIVQTHTSQVFVHMSTPWNRLFLENLEVTKYPTFYGNQWFTTVFTRAWHCTLSRSDEL